MAAYSHAGHMPSSGKPLAISAWLTGIYFMIELAVGLWTGSIAVLSDAFHTLSAVGGVLVAIIAQRIAHRPADMARSYGWYRAEIIGALVNGGFLLGMALLVIWMGAMRLGNPIHLPTGPMLWVAFGGLVTEVISLGLMWKSSQDDLNARGALWHIIQTFVGSLLIIVTALVIEFTGFLAIDPILGMGFGVVLLWASVGVIREAVHILLEGTPEDTDLEAVTADLRAQDGVLDVHHVHAWTLTSGKHAFSAHMRHAEPADAARILETAYSHLIKHHGFHMVTLQLETDCLDERHADELDVTQSMGPEVELHAPHAHRDHLDSAVPDANLEHNSKGKRHMKRRSFLLTGAAATLSLPAMADAGPIIKVIKTPTCGCCTAWVDHVRQAGFQIEAQDVDQDALYALKDRLQIAPELAGCHTAVVGDYFIEGHVPAEDIARLLSEQPAARGLTVPGMPMSSPGMGGPGAGDTFDTLLVGLNGATSVFASHS